MRSPGYAIALFITLRLASAIPTCPTQMMSSEVRVDDQQSLDQSISNLTSVPHDQSKCVTLIIRNRENYTYRIDLVELLIIKSNFVIIGLSLQQVKLDCKDTLNDTDNPLSGLEYVGFYRIAFYDCKLPLWMENITSVDMEEVTFRWVITGQYWMHIEFVFIIMYYLCLTIYIPKWEWYLCHNIRPDKDTYPSVWLVE